MANLPIGVIDSGYGGLSVLNMIRQKLPSESIIYYGDNAFCPYGIKDDSFLKDRILKIAEFVIEKEKCKTLVIACNTATALMVETLRSKYTLPIFGLEPGIKPAANNSKTGVIGALATEKTFKGHLFNNTSSIHGKNVKILIDIAHDLVELVENHLLNKEMVFKRLKKRLDKMKEKKMDHLVLGCTHFNFLKEDLQNILGSSITIYDSSEAFVDHLHKALSSNNLLREISVTNPEIKIFTSGDTKSMERFISSFVINVNTYSIFSESLIASKV